MRPAILTLVIAGLFALPAQAVTPKEQFKLDTTAAEARYADDKKLCAGEKDAAARMQCQRDAKTVFDQAQADNKARLAAASKPAPAPGAVCADCGKVVGVSMQEKAGESNAVGMLAGGAAGALLGNQIGKGGGRKLATIAGAVGGAYAGKAAQEKMNATKVWKVDVQYDNGKSASFNFDQDPGLNAGDRVRNHGQSVAKM
jgi:outer membrane lipoprotein SlyB